MTIQMIKAAMMNKMMKRSQIGHLMTILETSAICPSNSTVYLTLKIPMSGVWFQIVSLYRVRSGRIIIL